jgi:hypothetical protein
MMIRVIVLDDMTLGSPRAIHLDVDGEALPPLLRTLHTSQATVRILEPN